MFCFPEQKKILTYDDIQNGFKVFTENRGIKTDNDESWKHMYI